MMRQYLETKSQYEDCILFYRLGDFYEMFFEDAIKVSRELELTLTGKDCGQEERAPMCGIPYHAANNYIPKLIERGYKVAICEQMEDPALAKGIVKRDVIRVVTPATITDDTAVDITKNNFLAAVCKKNKHLGIAFLDFSTGELYCTDIDKDMYNNYDAELARFSPSEVYFSPAAGKDKSLFETAKEKYSCYVSIGEESEFETENALKTIEIQFGKTPAGLGMKEDGLCVNAVGAALEYIIKTQKTTINHISCVEYYEINQFMDIDVNSGRNLEITENMRGRGKKGSLLGVLDKTSTAMGARMLRYWLEHPLINPVTINNRLAGVEELYGSMEMRDELVEILNDVRDIERLTAKIVCKSANARDVQALGKSLNHLPSFGNLLARCRSKIITSLASSLDLLKDVDFLISMAIADNPGMSVKDGDIIREGFNETLDSYRSAAKDGKKWIADVEREEREKTGIKNLKVGYNRVFGYYIEISNSNKDKVPDYYIRKQTLTNGERFITPRLKEIETLIIDAQDKMIQLEYDLFCDVRDKIANEHERLQASAKVVSTIDCLNSLALAAAKGNYAKPIVDTSDAIDIKDGRHPVVESMSDTMFVPNDTHLNCESERLAIITGPNMAGKSTYMRQVAIITLMAQIGSFVPASSAHIGVIDKIFTRVGASDDLSSGQSTFMVEMSEVANILKNATKKSLIIYDEIGRGTSTYDGLSIAWAVLEYTADKRKCGAKTLFATHYHELTSLEDKLDGIVNYSTAVKKRGDDIIFLRKIVRGGADDSYGVEVARLAGVPDVVITRAKEILEGMEKDNKSVIIKGGNKHEGTQGQLSLTSTDSEVEEKLSKLDLNTITPIEALSILYDLKKIL
ncbi:MAG: DNA mismatch repair protein MutS [Bacillota bacterium]|nr:DNA mismatch repair protein MutS [Bacillota bacterium]